MSLEHLAHRRRALAVAWNAAPDTGHRNPTSLGSWLRAATSADENPTLYVVKALPVGCECEESQGEGAIACEEEGLNAQISVGFDKTGEAAGSLVLEQTNLGESTGTPAALTFSSLAEGVSAITVNGVTCGHVMGTKTGRHGVIWGDLVLLSESRDLRPSRTRRGSPMPNEARSAKSPSPSSESQPLRVVSAAKEIALIAQRTLQIEPGGSAFTLRAPDGQIELSVRITPDGPALSFAAASIEVGRTKDFKIEVERFELKARDIKVDSSGDLQQIVAGNCENHCAGRHELQAGAVSIISHDDTMVLDSTHDLAINGERVLINC